jgi:hypothetical protein
VSERTPSVLCEVATERERQDAKWGEQNHPSGTGGAGWNAVAGDGMREIRRSNAEQSKRSCDEAAREKRLSWRLILREEIDEAVAEDEGAALRQELLQVAAVAVAWIECIDRRSAGAARGEG